MDSWLQGHLTPWPPLWPVMARFQMGGARIRRSLCLIADGIGAEEKRGEGRKEEKGEGKEEKEKWKTRETSRLEGHMI